MYGARHAARTQPAVPRRAGPPLMSNAARTIVPLNDPARLVASLDGLLERTAADVVASGRYVLGPRVEAFEAAFAAYCGTPHCVGVANGTDAVELALRGCGIAAGDGVVVVANAAMYATTAVLAIGAVPVFADIDDAGLMDADTLGDALARASTPPRAVVATHLYGRMADMPSILEVAQRHGLKVVEDCAQAHGAHIDGRRAGAWGDASAFSFYPTKNLGALGDAGAVLTADHAIAGRVRQLRQYGWSGKYVNALAGGRNSRLDELQAALLLALLPGLDARNARRRAVATRYSREIVHPCIDVPAIDGERDVAHLYAVRSARRDALAAHLAASGVAAAVHYPVPDHRQPSIADRYADVALPATDAWCAGVLTLPCFPELRDDEADAVIAACNAWPLR